MWVQEAKRPVLQTPKSTHNFLKKGARGQIIYLLLPCLAAGGWSQSWLPEVGSGFSYLPSLHSRFQGVGVLTSSTPTLGEWASSAVLTAPGHPVWGSGLRTISCCPHCLLLPRGESSTMCQGLEAESQPHLGQSLPGDSRTLPC